MNICKPAAMFGGLTYTVAYRTTAADADWCDGPPAAPSDPATAWVRTGRWYGVRLPSPVFTAALLIEVAQAPEDADD